jgi:metal-dependent amidase/aminoacylase/carboxypeptidase family protein
MIVDLKGTGEESKSSVNMVAFRADIDALKMAENNELPYKSTTDHAHMCGHDGHMATLMTFADLCFKNQSKIPSNKVV